MARVKHRDEILALDPVRDHQRIVHLSTCYEFPWDTTRSLEFALFRSYCVPSISGLLDETGEFRERAQRRYDDTDLLVSELMEWGYDSERGTRALKRMNQLHGVHDISNDDFRYVLSTFVFEPIRWNARFGWRKMTRNERLAQFHFWREVGIRMNIRDVPGTYEAFETFNRDYERRHFEPCDTNTRIGAATVELFAGWFPRVLSPLVRRSIYALLDDPVLTAFGFPRPWPTTRLAVRASLKLRALGARFWPARRTPRLRTRSTHRSHPEGYEIEELGPPSMGGRYP